MCRYGPAKTEVAHVSERRGGTVSKRNILANSVHIHYDDVVDSTKFNPNAVYSFGLRLEEYTWHRLISTL